MKLLELPSTAALWNRETLRDIDLPLYMSPFELRDPEPGAILPPYFPRRREVYHEPRFVRSPPQEGVRQGRRLGQIWKECLIRRTYQSRMPFDSATTIGESLPRLHTMTYEVSISVMQQAIYDKLHNRVVKKLVYRNKRGKIVWSFKAERQLTLATNIMLFALTWHQTFQCGSKRSDAQDASETLVRW